MTPTSELRHTGPVATDPPLSALVVLRPRDGRELTGDAQITAETLAGYLPDPQAVEAARAYFRWAGYSVTVAAGISFSITGPRSLFERTFGGLPPAPGGLELPLDPLPEELRPLVQAVAFTPPPDFGPTSP